MIDCAFVYQNPTSVLQFHACVVGLDEVLHLLQVLGLGKVEPLGAHGGGLKESVVDGGNDAEVSGVGCKVDVLEGTVRLDKRT